MSAISYETYAGDRVTGDGEHVVVCVGDVRVAGAVRLRQRYSLTDPDALKWYVTPCVPGAGVVCSV